MDGVVKRYVPSKNFGFILGEDGKDYFFRDHHGTGEDITGAKAVFEPSANEKGYCARKLSIFRASRVLNFPKEVLVIQGGRNLTGDKVLVVDTNLWAESDAFRSRSDARRHLQKFTQQAGANAVLDVTYHISEQSSGNYIYSVYSYRGRLAVVGELSNHGDAVDGPQIQTMREHIHAVVNNTLAAVRNHALKKKQNANRRFILGTALLAGAVAFKLVTDQLGLRTVTLGFVQLGMLLEGITVALSGFFGRNASQYCAYSIGQERN